MDEKVQAMALVEALVAHAMEAERNADRARTMEDNWVRRGTALGLWRAANMAADAHGLGLDDLPHRLREKRVLQARYEIRQAG